MQGHGPAQGAGVHPQWAPSQADVSQASLDALPSVGPGLRLAARVIDAVLFGLLVYWPVLAFTEFSAAKLIESDAIAGGDFFFITVMIWLLNIVVSLLIIFGMVALDIVSVLIMDGSPGKRILGLRIVDAYTGTNPRFGAIFKRFIIIFRPIIIIDFLFHLIPADLGYISNAPSALWAIGLFMTVVTTPPAFQGWHDRFAKTRVVK